MPHHHLDHFAFQVRHMPASTNFYVEKLGFTLLSAEVDPEHQEAFSYFALADLRLELLQDLNPAADFSPPPVKPPYCPHLAIGTDDMAASVASLQQAGVPLIAGPLEIPGQVTWLYFCDLDNNVLEYVQWFNR